MSANSKIEWTDATWNPDPGLHENQPRLHALLCRDVRRAVPGREGPPLRAGLRPPARPGKARRAAAVDEAENDLRQLDERSVPQGRAGRLHRVGLPGDGAGQLAYLPGTDETVRAMRNIFKANCASPPPCRISGGESASRTEGTACRASTTPQAAGRRSGSCRSSRCWKTSGISIWKESTG